MTSPCLSEATRRRTRAGIRELGYHPHAGARALAGSRTRVLALVTPLHECNDTTAAMRFAARVVNAARRHDHDVLLLTQEEGEEGLRRVADSAMVDGIIIMATHRPDDPRLPLPRDLGRPCVLIDLSPGATAPAGPLCVGVPAPAAPTAPAADPPTASADGPPGAHPGPPEPDDLAKRCVALLMARLGAVPPHDEGPAVG